MPEWTITDRLRKAREVSGLDQGDFAHDIGVSRGTVSNYERGSKVHKRSILMTWAMRSGVPLEWLLTGQQEAPHPSESDEGQVVRREGLEPPTRWIRGFGRTELAQVLPFERRKRSRPTTKPAIVVPEAA